MLTEIPRLMRRVKYITPSDTNRIIDLRRFDVSQQFDRLHVLTDLIKRHNEHQNLSGGVCSDFQIPLPNLANDYHYAIDELEKANNTNIIKLNKPLHTRDINWETVLTSHVLGNNTKDFVFNMGTRKGWLNPSVQEHIKYIYTSHNIPQWIVDENLQVPNNISDVMTGWTYPTNTLYRYHLFVHGPKLLYDFDTNDRSFTNYAELKRIDSLAGGINMRLLGLHQHCMLLSNILTVEHKINKAGTIANLVKNTDLGSLLDMCFPVNTCRLKAHVIKSLIDATLDVPGGKERTTTRFSRDELVHTIDNVFRRFADRNYMGDPNNFKIVESMIWQPYVGEHGVNEDNHVLLLQVVQLYFRDGPVEFFTGCIHGQKNAYTMCI